MVKLKLSGFAWCVTLLAGCHMINATSAFAQHTIQLGSKGKTNFAIVIDPAAPKSVTTAAEELSSFINKSGGFTPRIIRDNIIPSGPYISLGSTKAASAAGITASGIQNDGFRIITKDGNLFILGVDVPDGRVNELGGVSRGTLHGVYTFLEDYLGIRWIMPGELGEVVPKVSTISIPAINREVASPFNYRIVPYTGVNKNVKTWENRMKLGRVADIRHHHYWAETIPPQVFDRHPDYFAQVNGKRLAPSGTYKLETTNPALVQAYADAILKEFRANPELKWYSLSPADGGRGWSDSPEALALTEKDPNGNLSRTPLVLKFYNDVAKIVRKEFPNHKLGGYIYASYLYPPAAGLPKLEPNLALVVATSISYGFQLYRPTTQETWDKLMRIWGESAKRDGFDVYFYDLPTALVQYNGILTPPAPDILNFIYSRLSKYGFKGAYVYGRAVWPAYGPGNYTLARLTYDPALNAHQVLQEYFDMAYGKLATPHIQNMFKVLDTAFRSFYIRHPKYEYNLTPDHLKEIYAPALDQIEQHYLSAAKTVKEPIQQKRLELLGQVLSLMQWNLKAIGLVPTTYLSSLSLNNQQVDQIITEGDKSYSIASAEAPSLNKAVRVQFGKPIDKHKKACIVPVYSATTLLLQPENTGPVTIKVNAFDALGEFVRFYLNDSSGKLLTGGAMHNGKTITFNGVAGNTYFLDIPSRRASIEMEVSGAATAYKANRHELGFRLNSQSIKGDELPLYFYVPEGTKDISLTLASFEVVAKVYAPSGKLAGTLNTMETAASRIAIPANQAEAGFYKVVLPRHTGKTPKIITLNLDERLPQWLLYDAATPLIVL